MLKETEFKDGLRNCIDLVQLLKYNVESFRTLDIHKEVHKTKDLRAPCAELVQALNGFIFKLQQRCDPVTFRGLNNVMQRDQLHELSLLMNMMYSCENLPEIRSVLEQAVVKI